MPSSCQYKPCCYTCVQVRVRPKTSPPRNPSATICRTRLPTHRLKDAPHLITCALCPRCALHDAHKNASTKQEMVEVEIREAPRPFAVLSPFSAGAGSDSGTAAAAATAVAAGKGEEVGGAVAMLPDSASLSPKALFRAYLQRERERGGRNVSQEVCCYRCLAVAMLHPALLDASSVPARFRLQMSGRETGVRKRDSYSSVRRPSFFLLPAFMKSS